MKTSIFDRLHLAAKALNGTLDPSEAIPVVGLWDVEVIRADGKVEKKQLRNVVTAAGLNRIANRAVQATGTTPFLYIAVGTQTAAHSLGSVQAGLGEVKRKVFVSGSSNAQSKDWVFGVATFAGNADTLSGVVMDSCAIGDHASSGSGILGNLVNGLGVTLADSDFLNLTMRIRVGSHDLAHST